MTFDDYQACLNALFAADRQLNLVQARFAASGAAGSTLDAFQLLRLAMVQCFERLEQQYARQYPDHALADVCALLRASALASTSCRTCSGVLRRRRYSTTPQGTTAERQSTALPAFAHCSGHGAPGGACHVCRPGGPAGRPSLGQP